MTEINIELYCNKFSFHVKGHTKSDVCTAISILTYTLTQNLIISHEKGELKELNYDLREGNSNVFAIINNKYLDKISEMIEFTKVGFLLLVNQYPDYVQIKSTL